MLSMRNLICITGLFHSYLSSVSDKSDNTSWRHQQKVCTDFSPCWLHCGCVFVYLQLVINWPLQTWQHIGCNYHLQLWGHCGETVVNRMCCASNWQMAEGVWGLAEFWVYMDRHAAGDFTKRKVKYCVRLCKGIYVNNYMYCIHN